MRHVGCSGRFVKRHIKGKHKGAAEGTRLFPKKTAGQRPAVKGFTRLLFLQVRSEPSYR
jgi:hypothetical protein